ncbi:MAG: hypothetical protein Q8K98_13660 [Bacteroidota bacterium]|nr:hypothetical protein [Bacteroidota bacterium]
MKHPFKTFIPNFSGFAMFLLVSLILGDFTLSTTAIGPAFAQASAGERQTRPTSDERLTRQTVGLVRVEEGVKNLEKRFDDMNRRIDGLETSLNKRIDELREFLLWGFGVMFAGMFALIGFVIWDRRTALAPVAKQTKELTANQEKILAALREHAKHDEKLMEFLKHAGLW